MPLSRESRLLILRASRTEHRQFRRVTLTLADRSWLALPLDARLRFDRKAT